MHFIMLKFQVIVLVVLRNFVKFSAGDLRLHTVPLRPRHQEVLDYDFVPIQCVFPAQAALVSA